MIVYLWLQAASVVKKKKQQQEEEEVQEEEDKEVQEGAQAAPSTDKEDGIATNIKVKEVLSYHVICTHKEPSSHLNAHTCHATALDEAP